MTTTPIADALADRRRLLGFTTGYWLLNTIEMFERRAHAPEKAARKIVRAIERNQARVRIGPEAYLTDWAKRLFPVSVQRLVGWSWRRSRH